MRISSQASLSRKGKFSIRIHRAQRQKYSQASRGVCDCLRDKRDKKVARIRPSPLYWASLSRTTSFTSAFKWLVKHIQTLPISGHCCGSGSGEWGGRRTIPRQVKVKMLVAQSVQLFVTPWTVVRQAPLSMESSRQEYWSGVPFPSPGELSDPGIEPRPPALQADFFIVWSTRGENGEGEGRTIPKQGGTLINSGPLPAGSESVKLWAQGKVAVICKKIAVQSSLSNQGSSRTFPIYQNSRMLKSFIHNFHIAYAYSLNTLKHL